MNRQFLPLALMLPMFIAPAQLSSQSSGETTLQTNVNLVLVDVVVTDKDKHIHGLDKSAFHIFEDGKEQRITSFDEHQPDANPAPIPRPPALPPNVVGNAPTYPRSDTINVLLLDALNTPAADQSQLHRQMLAYLEQLPPGKTIAIFTLTTRLRQLQGFTNDPSILKRALNQAKGGPQTTPSLEASDPEAVSKDSLATGSAAGIIRQFSAEVGSIQLDQRVHTTIDAMKKLAQYLSLLPGRKNLIWFSGSFPMALEPNWETNETFAVMRNYSNDVRDASQLLASARVAVYPVDIRGNTTPSGFDVTNPHADPYDTNTFNERATMQDLAEQSGGIAFVHTSDLMASFNAALENGESYYTIGYTPAAKDYKGDFHKIKVTLDGAPYTLTYRRGYYADASGKSGAGQSTNLLAATLLGAPESTDLQFIARALPATDPAFQGAPAQSPTPAGDLAASLKPPVVRYLVDLKVDPRKITFSEAQPGVHAANLEFVVVAYDAEGKRVNFLDRGLNLNADAQKFSSIQSSGILTRLAIDLPAGKLTLRLVVYDKSSNQLGAIELPLNVTAN